MRPGPFPSPRTAWASLADGDLQGMAAGALIIGDGGQTIGAELTFGIFRDAATS